MEEILLQNSKNITALIHLMKVHEDNIARLRETSPEDKDVYMKPLLLTECEYGSLVTPTIKFCSLSRSSFMPTDKVMMVRECGHIFKKEPFLEWTKTYSTCPRCKANLT